MEIIKRRLPSGQIEYGYFYNCIKCGVEKFCRKDKFNIKTGFCRNCMSKERNVIKNANEEFRDCSKCKKNLHRSEFERTSQNYSFCRKCSYLRKYRINFVEYEKLFENQNGLCAICNNPEEAKFRKTGNIKVLAVDHCHTTGKIRGLLCSHCNLALGQFKDNIEVLNNAIQYLIKNK